MPLTITLLHGPQRLDLIPILLFHETVQRQAFQPQRPLRGKAPRPLTRETGVQGKFEIDGSSARGQALLDFLAATRVPDRDRVILDAMTVERVRRSQAYSGVELWISSPPVAGAAMLIGFSASARMPV